MASGEERRRHRRVAVTWTAQAFDEARPVGTVEIVNVSESGLGIVSLTPMHAGARYLFKLPAWTEPPIEGVVRWADVGDVQTYAGVEFVDPTAAQLEALRALIARFDTEDWGISARRAR